MFIHTFRWGGIPTFRNTNPIPDTGSAIAAHVIGKSPFTHFSDNYVRAVRFQCTLNTNNHELFLRDIFM
jgi:hypothetical protein